jgi:hypothetical protein
MYQKLGNNDAERSRKVTIIASVCAGFFLLLIVVYIILENVITSISYNGFLNMNDAKLHENCNLSNPRPIDVVLMEGWFPGCGTKKKSNSCSGNCYDVEILLKAQKFYKANPGKLVSYKSRAHDDVEQVELTGWWLPAPDKDAPRVVIQHGFQGNSNEWRQTFWAYQFLSLNISVLLNNFRDHCYSNDSEARIFEWGHSYPYDLLGAWDFARMDPNGELGGSRPSEKVGLAGVSKGAFTTLNAIALEKDVPAAWADCPPYTPKTGFEAVFGKALGPAAPLFEQQVFSNLQKQAKQRGVNLMKHTPEKFFPQAPNTSRPLALEANSLDTTTPIANHEKYLALIEKYPAKFNLTSEYVVHKKCYDIDHATTPLLEPIALLQRLCEFWRPVFGLDGTNCTEADLAVPPGVSEPANEANASQNETYD